MIKWQRLLQEPTQHYPVKRISQVLYDCMKSAVAKPCTKVCCNSPWLDPKVLWVGVVIFRQSWKAWPCPFYFADTYICLEITSHATYCNKSLLTFHMLSSCHRNKVIWGNLPAPSRAHCARKQTGQGAQKALLECLQMNLLSVGNFKLKWYGQVRFFALTLFCTPEISRLEVN